MAKVILVSSHRLVTSTSSGNSQGFRAPSWPGNLLRSSGAATAMATLLAAGVAHLVKRLLVDAADDALGLV